MDAFLVIDCQNALLKGSYLEQEVLAAIQRTTNKIRESGGLMIFIQHCHTTFEPMMKGMPGWALHEALDIRDEDLCVEKQASDAFYETNLDKILRQHGVSRIYCAGLQTEFCVDATCRSALSKNYEVTLISDGHTTGDAILPAQKIIDHHNLLLANLAHPHRSIQVLASQHL